MFGSLGNGTAVRLHQAGTGEDRRVPGGVRPGVRWRGQRHHQERHQSLRGQPVRLLPPRRPRELVRRRCRRRTGPSTSPARVRTTSAARSAVLSFRTSCSSSAPSTPEQSHRLRRAQRLPAADLGSVPQDRRIVPYAAKATWQMNRPSASGRVVLRRSGTWRPRSAAVHGDAQSGHGRIQRARPVRRQQSDGALRGRDQQALAHRRIVRARREQPRRDAVGRSMVGDGRDGDSASAIGRASASTRSETTVRTGNTAARRPT